MFEVYTGTGDNKKTVGKADRLNEAVTMAWNKHSASDAHYGVLYNGAVIFSTNDSDPEFIGG